MRFGYTTEELISRPDMWLSLIHEDDRERVLSGNNAAIEQGSEAEFEYRIITRNGNIIWLHDKGRLISNEQGERIGWQGVMVDITRTKELEEQLRQAQKLESVGRLAGGIAHDFNNMLTAINGYSDLTLRLLKEEDPIRSNILEIKKAGERSALLTYQLLAFSRQQLLHPIVVDINETITDTIKIIQRLIGEDIEIVSVLKSKIGRVRVDPGQMSQILMNLAVNSRDAMPSAES
jgi:PAS domain S-box-containing protein